MRTSDGIAGRYLMEHAISTPIAFAVLIIGFSSVFLSAKKSSYCNSSVSDNQSFSKFAFCPRNTHMWHLLYRRCHINRAFCFP